MRVKMPRAMPIVNDAHFTDNHSVQKMASFSPAGNMTPAPPPKYVGVPGKKPMAKGLTNKRIVSNI